MTASSASWLFTRGAQSVRLARREQPGGPTELVVHGPGDERQVHGFASVADCMQRQSEIERRLMAEGFTLRHAPERRGGADRRRRTRNERRRDAG